MKKTRQIDLMGKIKKEPKKKPKKKDFSELKTVDPEDYVPTQYYLQDQTISKLCRECKKPAWKYSYVSYPLCEKCFQNNDPRKYGRTVAYNYYGKAYMCARCNSKRNVQWHHPNYFKPLEVIPLCKKCHLELHKQFKEQMKIKYKKNRWAYLVYL